jgi:DNA polymerase III delta prime subunit
MESNLKYLTKYRPSSLEEFVCTEKTFNNLQKILENPYLYRAYLFTGYAGSGKTTFARIIASLDKENTDVHEFNCADSRGIEFARETSELIASKSLYSKNRIIILDEAHQLTAQAQNTLLKPIEDGNDNTLIIFCSTDPQNILPTIKTRCNIINFNINSDDIKDSYLINKLLQLYNTIAKDLGKPNKENLDSILSEIEIITQNKGNLSIRYLVNYFVQIINNGIEDIEIDNYFYDVNLYTPTQICIGLKKVLTNNFTIDKWPILTKSIFNCSENPARLIQFMINYFSKMISESTDIEFIKITSEFLSSLDELSFKQSYELNYNQIIVRIAKFLK